MSEPVAGRHSDEEYLDAVREHQPAATSEVAAAVGVARQSADYRLRQLEDDGKVTSKRIGNSLAWSLPRPVVEPHGVNPEDAFWNAETYEGEATRTSEIDEIVYGEAETE